MAAATRRHLYAVMMSGGNRDGGRLLGVHGIHRMMFSSRVGLGGTPSARAGAGAGGLEAPPPPASHNQDYYRPPHHHIGQDYYNSTHDHSKISRDDNCKNMSTDQNLRLPKSDYDIKKLQQGIFRMEHNEPDYDFKKLQQRMFRMKHDFARHCEKFDTLLNEIRDERKKLNNDRDERKKLINELSKISEEKNKISAERDANKGDMIITTLTTAIYISLFFLFLSGLKVLFFF